MSAQAQFDFAAAEADRPFTEHFLRLEALSRHEFSEDALCLAWVTESDGRAWQDWWKSLPSYERERFLIAYLFEREEADAQDRPMCRYNPFRYEPSREEPEQHRGIVAAMAQEIREAALARKPMPRKESPDMSGFERLVFRSRLAEAMNQCGCVIITEAEG
jgi:hypothetical protein